MIARERTRHQAARPVASPGPAWLLVLHPDPEIAASRAATARRAFPASEVRWSTRGSDVVRSDRALPSGLGAVLVHIEGVDRFRADWAGHRVIARLAARDVTTVGWIAAGDRDGVDLARRSGAVGLFAPCGHDEHVAVDRVPEVRAVVRRALRGDAAPAVYACPNRLARETDADLRRWFSSRYATPWQSWIEAAVAVIVGGGERTEQAEALRQSLSPPTSDHALRRLRQITEALCGEIRGNEVVLRDEALVVLRRVARVRPIEAQPFVIRSMQRAAHLLSDDDTLAIEAGLTPDEVEELIEVATVELDASMRPVRRRGRPEAGAWRVRRDLALGRVAERRGSTAAEKLHELEGLRLRIDATLAAVFDALDDRERTSAR